MISPAVWIAPMVAITRRRREDEEAERLKRVAKAKKAAITKVK